MWYASIKVRVTLMLFPASWHSMTIWNCRCFLYPWLTTRVEKKKKKKKGARIVKGRLLFRKKKIKNPLPCLLLAPSDSNPTEGGENQRPQTSLIEAQLKHANALILFSLVVLLGLWRII